ncbi:enterochelin esterase domain-containing protein [Mumia flava]|uniref:enterochelin esterase domain-containing protein n=1 Tax=Mumia flava TaxID=1348852 RepID=UPI000AE11800|nr:enterochelin esterase domain-containing protein [Mumia flava]
MARLLERGGAAALEAYAARVPTPWVERAAEGDDAIVTFVWSDADAVEVLLFVNRLTDETDLGRSLMRRIEGTDLWTLSYQVSSRWRGSYAFLPRFPGQHAPWLAGDHVALRAALDRGRSDPTNPSTCRNRAGVVQSVAAGPRAPAESWLQRRPGVPPGTVERRIGPRGRTVWVYRPPGDAGSGGPSGAVVALDGDVWTSTQDLPTSLDNLIADGRIPPVHGFLLDSGSREERWRDLSDDGGFEDYLADDLLPWAREQENVAHGAESVVVAGQSLGGLSALRAGLHRPDAVGAVVSQSASLWHDDLVDDLERCTALPRTYLEVGSQEWVLVEPHRRLVSALERTGAPFRSVEFEGGHDYACWRSGIAEGLVWALGT